MTDNSVGEVTSTTVLSLSIRCFQKTILIKTAFDINNMPMANFRTRRDVLGIGASALAAGTLAGCLGSSDNGNTADNGSGNTSTATGSNANSGSPMAASSFSVLGDFASAVAGDVASVNTLVPVGQHGHGWSPSPQIQREALNSDLFIYMASEFQPWADDIVTNIENGGTSVTTVKAREGIDLLEIGSSHSHGEDEHSPAHGGKHGNDSDSGHRHEGETGHGHENSSGGMTDHHEHAGEDEHTDHNETGDHNGTSSHNETAGHDHGGVDPHFWLDPQRSKQAVENIREGFTTIDGNNAETYTQNAESYTHRLDELDRTFASTLKNTPQDVVLVAGHNAFQYLGSTYGFEIEALTGISPDDQPTPQNIAQAQGIIKEHDLEYVLAPALESDRAATQLVQQTDAKELLPITAMAGTTQKWQQKNWGYIDLMKNINLPSLKQALGAE
jgi:zinc transport system substrate-binding protein